MKPGPDRTPYSPKTTSKRDTVRDGIKETDLPDQIPLGCRPVDRQQMSGRLALMNSVVPEDGLQRLNDQGVVSILAVPDKPPDGIEVFGEHELRSAGERKKIERVFCHASSNTFVDCEGYFNGDVAAAAKLTRCWQVSQFS